MDRPPVHGEGGFLDGFGEGGVGVADAGDVLRAAGELHGGDGLGDHVAGPGPEDVHAEDAVGFGVGEDLHRPLDLVHRLGPAVREERELAHLVVQALGLRLLLGDADAGHLGPGVDHARDRVIVHVPRLARQDLGEGHALVLGLVSKHRAIDQVAEGRDRRDVGPEVMVGRDLSRLRIHVHADLAQPQAFGIGAPAHRDQDPVAHDVLLGPVLGRLDVDRDLLALDRRARDLRLKLDVEPLLRQALVKQVAHLDVGERRDPGQELDHGHLGTQPAPDRAQLQADVPAADHHEVLGDGRERQRLGRADDRVAVERQERQVDRGAAGRQQDVLGFEGGRAAFVELDDDAGGRGHLGGAVDRLDLVLLEEAADAVGEPLDDRVLASQHRREVELDLADLDAVLGELRAGEEEQLAGVEQGLARDAADVEAGAAEGGALLDAGHLHPKLSGADGGDIAAGAGSNDDQVEAHRSGNSIRGIRDRGR